MYSVGPPLPARTVAEQAFAFKWMQSELADFAGASASASRFVHAAQGSQPFDGPGCQGAVHRPSLHRCQVLLSLTELPAIHMLPCAHCPLPFVLTHFLGLPTAAIVSNNRPLKSVAVHNSKPFFGQVGTRTYKTLYEPFV